MVIELYRVDLDIFYFELRFKYCLLLSPDPTVTGVLGRHRVCRFGRTCRKSQFENCPMSGSCGPWEYDHIKHESGPQILPFDGLRKKRRRNLPQPKPLQSTPRKSSDPREVQFVYC